MVFIELVIDVSSGIKLQANMFSWHVKITLATEFTDVEFRSDQGCPALRGS